MSKLAFSLLLAIAFFLAGCAAPVTQEDFDKADFGAPPTTHDAQIKAYFSKHLKDPFSAQYQGMTAPEKGVITLAPIAGSTKKFGWLVKETVNAKNAYGAYVGWQTYTFLFRGDELIHVMEPQ